MLSHHFLTFGQILRFCILKKNTFVHIRQDGQDMKFASIWIEKRQLRSILIKVVALPFYKEEELGLYLWSNLLHSNIVKMKPFDAKPVYSLGQIIVIFIIHKKSYSSLKCFNSTFFVWQCHHLYQNTPVWTICKHCNSQFILSIRHQQSLEDITNRHHSSQSSSMCLWNAMLCLRH